MAEHSASLQHVLRLRARLRQGCALLVLAVVALGPARLGVGELPVPITIVGNGWHAGLLLPAAAIHQRLPALQQRFPQAAFYEIGWGDVGFYRATEVSIDLALQAMFDSQGAVMHVVAVPDVPRFVHNADIAQFCVTPAQYQRMADWVAASFVRNAQNAPISAGPGIYGGGEFYHASGRYHLFNTCNRWTAGALQAGGLDVSPRLSLTASRVLYSARWQGQPCPVLP